MAIVEMSKITLYGVIDEKQKILNSIFKSKLIQLDNVEELKNTKNLFNEEKYSSLDSYCSKIEKAISTIEEKLPQNEKIENTFDIKLEEFEKYKDNKDNIKNILEEVEVLQNKITQNKIERTNLENKILQLNPYKCISEPFSYFKSTKHVNVYVGLLPNASIKELEKFINSLRLSTFEIKNEESGTIIVYSHIIESELVFKKLNELGFSKCNFDFDKNATFEIEQLQEKIKAINEDDNKNITLFHEFKSFLKELKISRDYIKYLMETEESENKLRSTNSSFVLKGFLAKENEEKVSKLLEDFCVEFDFSKPRKNEMPPTITKNNKVVKQFEFVTNMYSAPNYKELDPNTFIAIFFSLFFGFVMADIGYGLCLCLFGTILSLKQKHNTGFKQLMNVLIIGGVASIIFGIMFGSFFGLSHENLFLVPKAILPNPVDNVVTLLVSCFAAGAVQIMVSFVFKGVLLVKRGRVLEAILTAFIWDLFFIGIGLFALDFAGIVTGLKLVGGVIAGVSVLACVVGQIIINKGFEKFSKSFGSVYGIINLFSDILSYARLFGLMLSGAIIGSIVNQLASDFLLSPVTFIVGVIILAIGHSFNLAMGALGAYVHVARLQYIEFFSRFYEGEGEVFVPFGQKDFSYVNLI